MELIQVAKSIELKIEELDKLRDQLADIAQDRARATAAYDKEIAKTLIRLRNGDSFEIEAYKVEAPPVSIMDKVAKGLCWEGKLKMDMSETMYKNLLVKIEIVKAQLNAFQSIQRNLSHL